MIALALIAVVGVALFAARFAASSSSVGELPCVSRVAWSPNKNEGRGVPVDRWIWHYTAAARSSVAWLVNPDSKVSAHFEIDRDGTITQMVPLDDVAWHAGSGAWNARSIGVELVNPGIVYPSGSGGWEYGAEGKRRAWRPDLLPESRKLVFSKTRQARSEYWVPYTAAQRQSMVRLVHEVERTQWAPACSGMVGHEDIASPVGRKVDPGPLFPWHLFAGRRVVQNTEVV